MIRGQYKKVLWEIFDVLGFFEHEKERALEGFKKKFANALLMEIRSALSDDQRQWIAGVASNKEYDKSDPKIQEIQGVIDSAFPKSEFDKISHSIFKNILASYVSYMSPKVDTEKVRKLHDIKNTLEL